MNGSGFADTLPARQFVHESDCGRIFDVQGHGSSNNSTF
jgi:hypothetical protein